MIDIRKKTAILITIFIAFEMSIVSESHAARIKLEENNNIGNYQTIQDKINNAPEGSTIYIKAGVYTEILNIKKKITLIGESKDKTIINPISDKNKFGIRLGAPDITIKKLSITNGGPGLYTTGIKITSSGAKIEDCNIYDTPVGISIFTSNNIIQNCKFWGCKDEGIALIGTPYSDCKNNEIRNCIFYNNCDGIELQYSSENTIINCEFFDNTHTGIDAITLLNNKNTILNCKIYNNNVHGIFLHSSSDNQIINCILFNNKDGNIIECKNSQNNEIKNSGNEHLGNNIGERLINFLKLFEKRYSKVRVILLSIFDSYQNLQF